MAKQLNSCKELVASLIHYFELECENNGPLLPVTAIRERVAAALNLNISTVSMISQADKNNEVLKSPPKKRLFRKRVTNTIRLDTGAIRNVIYEMYKSKMEKEMNSLFSLPYPLLNSCLDVNASMINYVPSSFGGSFENAFSDDINLDNEDSSLLLENETYKRQQDDDRCEQLWRTFRDEAGLWISHRFTLAEWDYPQTCTQEPPQKLVVDDLDNFDGSLTQEIVASGLSKVDRCPEFGHYAFTKCILHKRRLSDIEALKNYIYLQYVDVSDNNLITLKPLGTLPFLKYLDASHNHLQSILDFRAPLFLTHVNLSHNRIRFMRNLSDFWSITDLNLSYNAIRVINGIMELRYLTSLNLSHNRIDTLENLNNLRVQFLYLQNNNIKSHEDDEKAMLYSLNNIRTINLCHNQFTSLKMFEAVENLECLDIQNNHISKLLDIYYLRNLKYLNNLNLMGNPITNIRRYVEVCIINIRNLVFLDGERINYDFWLQKMSTRGTDVNQIAAHQRLKLLILEQLNQPRMWDWLLPYDSPPLDIIVLVGLQGCRRAHIARKFCRVNNNVVVGIPYTTRPKLKDEVEGSHYYYVTDEVFRTMLKNGEFLTYQENLGYHYGFAHSEFRKAEHGILLFYCELTNALAIKSRFLNTKLVLTLPSTRKVHLKNLTKLFAVQLLDIGTMKIVSSPIAAKHCEIQFALEKKKLDQREVQLIVEQLVNSVVAYEIDSDPSKTKIIKSVSDTCQLWSTSRDDNERSHYNDPSLQMLNESEMIFREQYVRSETSQRRRSSSPTQMPKYVSFTVARSRTIAYSDEDNQSKKSELHENFQEQHVEEEPKTFQQDVQDAIKEKTGVKPKENPRSESWMSDDDLGKVRPMPSSTISAECFMKHACYAEILSDDERLKSIFNVELNRRDDLLELHWSIPGLFREMLFSDHDEEAIEKLHHLVRDIMIFNESKPMFKFENDQSYKSLTGEKIRRYFKDLETEIMLSQKQAAEYFTPEEPNICNPSGPMECSNPACPSFDVKKIVAIKKS